MCNEIENHDVSAQVVSGLTMEQYLSALYKPILIAASVNLFCSFAPISLRITLGRIWWILSGSNFVITTVCLIWAGQIAYKHMRPSIIHASLAGPLLSFFSLFLVGLVSRLRYMPGDWEPPARVAGTLLGNKLLICLVAAAGTYLLFFPVSMGLAALGAVYAKRKI